MVSSSFVKLAVVALAMTTQVASAQDVAAPAVDTPAVDTPAVEPVEVDIDAVSKRVNPCHEANVACRAAYKTLPACPPGEMTTFTTVEATGCKCPSCKQAGDEAEEKQREAACTLDAVSACRELLKADATTPECESKDAFKESFDKATCCSTCKPKPPTGDDMPDAGGKCTLEQVKDCAADVRVCEDGEERERIEGTCCGTCTRPKLSCSLEQLATCASSLPECADGQQPRFDKTSCCGVCKPARPACATKCPDGKVCIGGQAKFKTLSPGFEVPQCVASKGVKKALNFLAGSRMAKFMASANCEEVGTMVKEMVHRYCDKPQNVDRCAPVLPAIDGLLIKCEELTAGATAGEVTSINLDIEVPTLDGTAIAKKIRTRIEEIRKTKQVVMPKPKTDDPVAEVLPVADTDAAADVNVDAGTVRRRLLQAAVTTEVIVNEALADEEVSKDDGMATVTAPIDYNKGSAAGVAPSIVVAIASVMALLW